MTFPPDLPEAAPAEIYPEIPGYRIMGLVGEGGTGKVYAAEQVDLGRWVAIKSFNVDPKQHDYDDFYQRFLNEARILGQIGDHENIIQIYDVIRDEQQQTKYIVMQLVEGTSMEDARKAQGKIPLDKALRIIADAAGALHHAHKRGVIHRDIKPANIMITTEGKVKLMDFGIARSFRVTSKTRTGLAIGTPHYMSPEQILDVKTVDARSDVYSLSIALYELASGKLPFNETNLFALADKVRYAKPEAPSALNPELDPELDAIILKGMEKKPEDRFQTAGELEAAIRGYLASPKAVRKRPSLRQTTGEFECYLQKLGSARETMQAPPPEILGAEAYSTFAEMKKSPPGGWSFEKPGMSKPVTGAPSFPADTGQDASPASELEESSDDLGMFPPPEGEPGPDASEPDSFESFQIPLHAAERPASEDGVPVVTQSAALVPPETGQSPGFKEAPKEPAPAKPSPQPAKPPSDIDAFGERSADFAAKPGQADPLFHEMGGVSEANKSAAESGSMEFADLMSRPAKPPRAPAPASDPGKLLNLIIIACAVSAGILVIVIAWLAVKG